MVNFVLKFVAMATGGSAWEKSKWHRRKARARKYRG